MGSSMRRGRTFPQAKQGRILLPDGAIVAAPRIRIIGADGNPKHAERDAIVDELMQAEDVKKYFHDSKRKPLTELPLPETVQGMLPPSRKQRRARMAEKAREQKRAKRKKGKRAQVR